MSCSRVSQQQCADDVVAVRGVELASVDAVVDELDRDRRQVARLHIQKHRACNNSEEIGHNTHLHMHLRTHPATRPTLNRHPIKKTFPI